MLFYIIIASILNILLVIILYVISLHLYNRLEY